MKQLHACLVFLLLFGSNFSIAEIMNDSIEIKVKSQDLSFKFKDQTATHWAKILIVLENKVKFADKVLISCEDGLVNEVHLTNTDSIPERGIPTITTDGFLNLTDRKSRLRTYGNAYPFETGLSSCSDLAEKINKSSSLKIDRLNNLFEVK